MEPEEATSRIISCINVPLNLLNKVTVKKHFEQFGRIIRIVMKRKSKSVTVEFDTVEGALNAKENGCYFENETFPIVFTKHKPIKVKKVKAETDLDDWTHNPEVQEELRAMRHDSFEKNYNLRSSAMDVENVSQPAALKKVRRATSEIVKAHKSLTKSKETELLSLLKQAAFTTEEKYKLLDARDKLIRLRRARLRKSLSKNHTVGTCPDMCPEKERLMREIQYQVALYEQHLDKTMDHSKAVKQYSRSSADQEAPLPHDLRNVDVLKMTMGYLTHEIMDLSETPDVNLADWFHFLWDRTRGIRKDITQQELCCLGSASLVEQCARFHIHCSARLIAEDASVFDQKINTENLTKCLQTLKYMYHDLCLKGVECGNEAEFRAYIILLNLNNGNFLWELQQLRVEIQKSREVSFALNVYSALDKHNYVKFFKLVRSTSYLNACLLMRYFVQVRMRALGSLLKCYTPAYSHMLFPLDELKTMLAFEDFASTIDFLEYNGLRVNSERTHLILNRNNFISPEALYSLDRAIKLVESKRQQSIGEVIAGGELPPKFHLNHKLHCSFNEDGFIDISEFNDLDETDNRIKSNIVQKQNTNVNLFTGFTENGGKLSNFETKSNELGIKRKEEKLTKDANEIGKTTNFFGKETNFFLNKTGEFNQTFQHKTFATKPAELKKNEFNQKSENLTPNNFGQNRNEFEKITELVEKKNTFGVDFGQNKQDFGEYGQDFGETKTFENKNVFDRGTKSEGANIFTQKQDETREMFGGNKNIVSRNIFLGEENIFKRNQDEANLKKDVGKNIGNIFGQGKESVANVGTVFTETRNNIFGGNSTETQSKSLWGGMTSISGKPDDLTYRNENQSYGNKRKLDEGQRDRTHESRMHEAQTRETQRHETRAREAQRHEAQARETQTCEAQRHEAQRHEAQTREAQTREAQRHEAQTREAQRHETQTRETQRHEAQARETQRHLTQRHEAQSREAQRHEAQRRELQSYGFHEDAALNKSRKTLYAAEEIKSKLASEEILKQKLVENFKAEKARQEEVFRVKAAEETLKKDVSCVLSKLVSEVSEKLKLERLKMLKENYLTRRFLLKWKRKLILIKRKRKSIESSPFWIPNTPEDIGNLSFTQDFNLSLVKRYKSGIPEKISPPRNEFKTSIQLPYAVLRKVYCLNSEIYWKICVYSNYGLINEFFNWDNFNCVQKSSNKVNCCLKKISNETDVETNGFIFITQSIDQELISRVSRNLSEFRNKISLPLVVLTGGNDEVSSVEKLNWFLNEGYLTELKIYVINPRKFVKTFNESLSFLAENSGEIPPLELQLLRDLLDGYFRELFEKIKVYSNWNPVYKRTLTAALIIDLINEGVDRLKEVLYSRDCYEFSDFPREFNRNETEFTPCDYKYFPVDWKSETNRRNVHGKLDELKLIRLVESSTLEEALFNYCNALNFTQIVFYKAIGCVKDYQNPPWIEIFSVLFNEKIARLNCKDENQFDTLYAIYDRNVYKEFVCSTWYNIENVSIKGALRTIEFVIEDDSEEEFEEVEFDWKNVIEQEQAKSDAGDRPNENSELDELKISMGDLAKSMELQRKYNREFEEMMMKVLNEG